MPERIGATLIVTPVQFQELRVGREALLMSNRSLAEDSLTRRPRLCSGKFQLAKKYRELSNLAAACWEKQSQLGELTGWWFLDLEGARIGWSRPDLRRKTRITASRRRDTRRDLCGRSAGTPSFGAPA